MAFMKTYCGHSLDFDNFTVSKVDIRDIAHSLSLQCRFNGNIRNFYSVAQHSVLVAMMVRREKILSWGEVLLALLHDASEAYMGDIIRPMKTDFHRKIEKKFAEQIARKFEITVGISNNIIDADNRMLLTEFNSPLIYEHNELEPTSEPDGYKPYSFKISPWSMEDSEQNFLREFRYIWPCYLAEKRRCGFDVNFLHNSVK